MISQITFIIQMDGKDEEDSGLFWLRRVEVMREGRDIWDFGRKRKV